MRAADIIRNLLDLMDEIDCPDPAPIPAHAEMQLVLPANDPIVTAVDANEPSDKNHFRQIFDILSAQNNKMYSNSPAEVVAGIESVTTHAGGGLNGPKSPADMRADSVAMYPNFQAKGNE